EYHKGKTTEYSGPEIFGLHLEFVEEWIKKQHPRVLQLIDNLSLSAQRDRANKIAKLEYQTFKEKCESLYHSNDNPTLQSLTYKISNQTWIIDFNSKNKEKKEQQAEQMVYALDQGNISRESYRSLAAILFELPREYIVATSRYQIDNIMKLEVPIHILDINNLSLEKNNINKDDEIHIDDSEIVENLIDSVGKCGYRTIKQMLLFLIPVWISKNILTNQDSTIYI
ncbi:14039_t:CDS:1, partial [Racocetra fulgida]